MPTTEITNWGDAIFLSISNALNSLLAAIPQIIGALLIIIIGWILAGIVAKIVSGLLEKAGADRMFAERGGEVYGEKAAKVKPSTMAGEIVKWIIRFVFLVAAANVLGLTQVSVLLNQVLLWIPNLIVAAVILMVAPLLARFVSKAIEAGAGKMGFSNASTLGKVAEIAIVAFAVVIAINQIGIAADLVNILFIGLVVALALAFGLAFGLGGKDVAAQLTQSWYESSKAAAEKVKAKSKEPKPKETAPPSPRAAPSYAASAVDPKATR